MPILVEVPQLERGFEFPEGTPTDTIDAFIDGWGKKREQLEAELHTAKSIKPATTISQLSPAMDELAAEAQRERRERVVPDEPHPVHYSRLHRPSLAPYGADPFASEEKGFGRAPPDVPAVTLPELKEEAVATSLAALASMQEPIIPIPEITGQELASTTGLPPFLAKPAAALITVAGDIPRFMLSPIGIGMMETAAAGPVVSRLAAGVFAADMLRGLPDQGKELDEAIASGDSERIIKAVGRSAITGYLGAKLARHATRFEDIKLGQQPLAEPRLPASEQAFQDFALDLRIQGEAEEAMRRFRRVEPKPTAAPPIQAAPEPKGVHDEPWSGTQEPTAGAVSHVEGKPVEPKAEIETQERASLGRREDGARGHAPAPPEAPVLDVMDEERQAVHEPPTTQEITSEHERAARETEAGQTPAIEAPASAEPGAAGPGAAREQAHGTMAPPKRPAGMTAEQSADVRDLVARAVNLSRDPRIARADTRLLASQIEPARLGDSGPLAETVTKLESQIAPPKTPAVPGPRRVSIGVSLRRKFERETDLLGDDILSWMADNMTVMSPSAAKKLNQGKWWKVNSSLYDDFPAKLAAQHHYEAYGGRNPPDTVAQAAFEAGKLPDPTPAALGQAIKTATRQRTGGLARLASERKSLGIEQEQFEKWTKASQAGPIKITSDQLKVGDQLQVGVEAADIRLKAEQAADEERTGKIAEGKELEEEARAPLTGSGEEVKGRGIVGKGAAVPAEFAPRGESPLATKFRMLDAERQKRGLAPLAKADTISDQEVLNRAIAELERNPALPDRLVSEISANPTGRILQDWENQALDLRLIELRDEFHKSAERAIQAYDDAQRFPDRQADMVEANLQTDVLSDRLTEIETALRLTAAPTGRALRSRQVMINEDMTLADLELRARADRGGLPISVNERAAVKAIADEYKKRAEAAEKAIAERDERLARLAIEKSLVEMEAEAAKKPAHPPVIIQIAERLVHALDKQADVARARLRGKVFSLSPDVLVDLAEIGASHIAHIGLDILKWSDAMIRELGERVRPHLEEIWGASQEKLRQFEAAIVPQRHRIAVRGIVERTEERANVEIIKRKIEAKARRGELDTVGMWVRKLERGFVAQGIRGRDALVDAVHDVLQDLIPGITRRETMDAMSWYGKYKLLAKDEISLIVRDINGQLQQLAKIQDIEAGRPISKTGIERRAQSDEERRLVKLVNEAKRKFGVVVTDPATQLRSILASRKTWYTHALADMRAEIQARQRLIKTKTPSPTDPELDALISEYHEVKAQHDEMFAPPELSDEQRLARAISVGERNLAAWNERLADARAGIFDRKRAPGRKVTSTELEAIQAQTQSIKEEVAALKLIAHPKKSPLAIALQTRRTRLAKEIADLKQRIADGDYADRPRQHLQLDEETLRLVAERDRFKAEYEAKRREYLRAKRERWQKALDFFVRMERQFKLSSPVVFGKLTAAGVTRLAETVTSELVGGIISHIVPGLAEGAPREGGLNVAAIARGFRAAFDKEKGLYDAMQTLRTGRADIDVLYGDKLIDPDWLELFGRMHGMMKAPIKRFEFELAIEKRAAWYAKRGVDVTTEEMKTKIMVESLADGYRAIFMQHGFTADMFNRIVGMLEGSKDYRVLGEVSARSLRFLFPIVRVPSSIVGETTAGAVGLPVGLSRLFWAMRKGLDNVTPEIKDSIMRQLKKGSVGAVLMAIGYFNADNIGGFYQPGERRRPGDVKALQFRVWGWDVPRWLTHAPWFLLMQIGAQIKRTIDKKFKAGSPPNGITDAMWAASLGLIEEAPFVGQILRVDKLFRSDAERKSYWGELLKGTLVPQILQAPAVYFDKTAEGEKIQRRPDTVLQHVMTGIPFLRQQVEEARPRR